MKRVGRKSNFLKVLDNVVKSASLPSDVNSFSNDDSPLTKKPKLALERLPGTEDGILMPAGSEVHQDNIKSTVTTNRSAAETVLLVQLSEHIPTAFKHARVELSAMIMSVVFEKTYEEDEIQTALDEADVMMPEDIFKVLCGTPPEKLLWKATSKLGKPVNMFLAPPVSKCITCSANLQKNHDPTRVIVFTIHGPLPAQKIILRCKSCNINYRYDTYGGESMGGYRYYDSPRNLVVASNVCLIEKGLCEQWISAGHHSWVSFEGATEIYNETMRETENYNYLKLKEYLQRCSLDDDEKKGTSEELHRKNVAEAFWNYQVENELREGKAQNRIFNKNFGREDFMNEVDILRATSTYPHKKCSNECRKRGCGKLWAIDGNWKLRYPICMYESPKEIVAFSKNLNYVNSCPNSPVFGMAFCKEHVDAMQSMGIPTVLKEFLHYKKTFGMNTNVTSTSVLSAAACQGTSKVKEYVDFAKRVDCTDEVTETKTTCHKDTGDKVTLQKWTRGVFFCVNGGGHIHTWQPLYKSEGPAQVFLIVLTWLISEFGCKGRDMWKQITIAYDNMCHLNNLRVARQPLPLPGDLKFIWSDINKVIDDLHIKNHKDSSCRQQYNTDTLKKENPHFNTMACEQTFAWLSRHKHILYSMPKSHFHFYLHRMVMRRNKYISHCYSVGRRIVPVKNKKSLEQGEELATASVEEEEDDYM